MNGIAPLVMYAWIPAVALLFALLPAARAVVVAYLAGWMFLPVTTIEPFGFDYSKATAVPLVVFAAVLAFDSRRLAQLRFQALDLPVAVFCAAPLFSSLANDLGWRDGLSALLYQSIAWGLPYLTGRLYFSTPEGLRRLALGLLAGGLVYLPLCLWEIRMSPQLHSMLYGFHQHDWSQTLRGGGYRPVVFMAHGLMLALWMGAAVLVGLALWMGTTRRTLWGVPLGLLVTGLVFTLVLCKSFGALVLVLLAALALVAMRSFRTSLPMAVLVCLPASYVLLRTVGAWSGAELSGVVSEVSSERANSLSFRLAAEEKLRLKAAERPLFGWGGWGRSFVRQFDDDPGRAETVITDSLWILVFGKYGAVGLVSLLLSFCVPVLALWRRCPPRLWASPGAALPWALGMALTLYAIDNLVNAMVNPVYLLIAGGLCGLAPARVASAARVVPVKRIAPRPRAALPASVS